MLRYRGYDWTLLHGKSRVEVDLGLPGGSKKPMWGLELHFVAVSPEWRRCGVTSRPYFEMSIEAFDVERGDWRNIAGANHWNVAEGNSWPNNPDGQHTGWFHAEYNNRSGGKRECVTTAFGGVDWRVVELDGTLVTIEASSDTGPANSLAAEPGAEEAGRDPEHELYVLETLPFGLVTVRVPRNAPDPFAYAETVARRELGLPAPDHVRIRDYKDKGSDLISGDFHVELHFSGYHGT